MAKDTSSGGFLSKVVKFVRHPTTSWSALDTQASEGDSGYDKAALKEVIERKRRNDFVRKREFDVLRKVRSRGTHPQADGQDGPAGVRPSFFQSSLPSGPGDRATTIKKIDEIEAQMSMQWWKTRGPEALSTGSGPVSGAYSTGGTPLTHQPQSAASPLTGSGTPGRRTPPLLSETASAPVVPSAPAPSHPRADLRGSAAAPPVIRKSWVPAREVTLARPASTPPPPLTGVMVPTLQVERYNAQPVFSASHFFAMDVHEIAQDPEVEEAAIRFANGDDAGAEQGLLEALDEHGSRVNQQDDWLALFDLYRATGQLAPFESRAVDFVNRFNRSAPQWYDMPQAVARLSGKAFKPSSGPVQAVWDCEPDIDAHAVGTLQRVLLRAHQPWVLDWTAARTLDVKAARALLGIFTLWGDQEVSLVFLGTNELCAMLQSLTPSGRRDVEQIWWELRMAALRVMNRPNEFELTALDYCVTYEVSPPGWERPRCQFQSAAAGTGAHAGQSVVGTVVMEQVTTVLPMDSATDSQGSLINHLGLVELSGEICGDPQETLDALEQRLTGADVLIISCRDLIRVDFSAAGTLLNWVSRHQAQGRPVQFVDAHRLVCAFFHVVGITEHAKVVLRND